MFALLMGLVGAVIAAAIFSLIGALFLMLAAKLVAKAKVGYGKAYGLTFIVFVLAAISSLVVMMVMGIDMMVPDPANQSPLATHNIAGNVIGFLIGAWIYGSKISDDSGPIGFGKGAAISLVLIAIGIGIGMILMSLMGGAMMAGAGG